jgi:3-oxoacyl-[acyl-carrier-protein] synthase II
MKPLHLTGIASVSPYGVFQGVIPQLPLEARAVTNWKTEGVRRAYTVEPFRPVEFVPGIKTRRLDRLSTWALVAASLAIHDAGIDLTQVDRSRVAVIFSTSFGCVEHTEAFFQSAAVRGWGGTDPILFPETLANSPASHVALFHQLRGPNITMAAKSFGGESALLQAASLLRHGQADVAIVLAGDVLTQAIYQWYEAAGMLSPECFTCETANPPSGLIPSEGVAAIVMESCCRSTARTYARLIDGRWAAGGDALAGSASGDAGGATLQSIRRLLGERQPDFVICTGAGAPCNPCTSANSVAELAGLATLSSVPPSIPPERFAAGLVDTGGLFHLILALRGTLRGTPHGESVHGASALMLGTSGAHGHAALLLEILPV